MRWSETLFRPHHHPGECDLLLRPFPLPIQNRRPLCLLSSCWKLQLIDPHLDSELQLDEEEDPRAALSTLPVSLFVPIALRISQIRTVALLGRCINQELLRLKCRRSRSKKQASSANYKMRNDKDETRVGLALIRSCLLLLLIYSVATMRLRVLLLVAEVQQHPITMFRGTSSCKYP